MVKPIPPSGTTNTGTSTLSPQPAHHPTANTAGYQSSSAPALQNLRGGGLPGAGSVVTDRQRAEAYQNIEGEMDLGTQALSEYRQTHNPECLATARAHLEVAQNAYQNTFSSSEGSIMIREGTRMSTYDVGALNTRLNAAFLSLRRSEQVERASH